MGSFFSDIKNTLLGRPRDIRDPHIFHRISLVAVLAWVGLGADGLSSSSYGPEQAYLALGEHRHLAVFIALLMVATVLLISYAYTRIIEAFPGGGGGYLVASKLLGEGAGVTSGSALLVDYVLTITTSVASGVDALWSLMPPHLSAWRMPVAIMVLTALVVLNLRGVKESVTILSPIFFIFLVAHAFLIGGGIFQGLAHPAARHMDIVARTHSDLKFMGLFALLALFFRAYSLGGGTYTGIEAVSNGLPMMREPRVETGKKTMLYMAVSLAITAAGIMVCYYLLDVHPESGKTLNAVLTERFAAGWGSGFSSLGQPFLVVVLLSEALLLFVAAQSGFLDGPRVMANMAVDSWFPHRFAALSERLTMQNGVLLMGGSALALLIYSHGSIEILVTMYSINVFLTFSLSQLAMVRYWLQARKRREHWKRNIAIHVVGLGLCAGMLVVTVLEKFTEGGWLTLLITSLLIVGCVFVRRHYRRVSHKMAELDEILAALPGKVEGPAPELRKDAPTAALLVSGYNGLGIHSLLWLMRLFPGYFKNVVFVSVGVLDSANFKGAEETEALRLDVGQQGARMADVANRLGLAATSRIALGTEVVAEAEKICLELAREFPKTIVFASKLIFRKENLFQGVLHNETPYAIQRRLQFSGLQTVILPVRVRP